MALEWRITWSLEGWFAGLVACCGGGEDRLQVVG